MHGADLINPIEVTVVEIVFAVWTRGVVDFNEIAVDQGYFEGVGVEKVVLCVVVARVASDVGHVQININKFLGETLDDVQISPISKMSGVDRGQVNLHNNLVNEVEVFDW